MAKAKDIKVKSTVVVLGEKERNLAFDMNAFIYLEEKFGTIDEAFEQLQPKEKDGKAQMPSMKALLSFLYAGLISDMEDKGEELTEKQVGKFFGLSNMNELSGIIMGAVTNALPDKKDGQEKNEQPANQPEE